MEVLSNASLDVGADQVPELIDPTNYADDPKLVEQANDVVLNNVTSVRQNRRVIQDRWDRMRAVWLGQHIQKTYDSSGGLDLYVRIGFKVVETLVSHIKARVFPSIDALYIEPSPFDPVAQMQAPIIRQLMRHDVDQAKIQQRLDTFLRNGLIEGPSVVKVPWMTRTTRSYRRVAALVQPQMQPMMPGMPPMPGMPQIQTGFSPKLTTFEGPGFLPIRNVDFYVHPRTVTELQDADWCMEDTRVDMGFLRSMANRGIYSKKALQKVIDKKTADFEKVVLETAVSKDLQNVRYGITETMDARISKNVFIIHEFYCKLDLGGDGELCPVKMTTCEGEILELRQNPWFDQEAPYLVWKCMDIPGNFYGSGVLEPIEHLNVAANGIFNQMIDAVRYQTNHITGVNRALLGQDISTLRLSPRALWSTIADPNTVFMPLRPPDNTQSAMMALQMLSGLVQDIGSAPPLMQGKFSNSDKTATEIQNTAFGAMASLFTMVRNVESQVLSPWLFKAWMREQQFRAVESAAKISRVPIKIAPQDLVGEYNMRFLVSTEIPGSIQQAQDQTDTQQAMPGIAGGMPPMPGGPGGPGMPGMPPGGMPPPGGPVMPSMPGLPPGMGMGSMPNMGM